MKKERNRKYLLTINNPEKKGLTKEKIIKNIKKYNGVLRWQLDGLHPEDCPLMYFSWAGAFSVTVPSSILGVEPALEASPMEKSPAQPKYTGTHVI